MGLGSRRSPDGISSGGAYPEAAKAFTDDLGVHAVLTVLVLL